MSPDVITTLSGKLGNQLFQYAATLKVLADTGGSTYRLLLAGGREDGAPDISDFLGIPTHRLTLVDRARWRELAATPGRWRPVLSSTARLGERVSRRVVVHQRTGFSPAMTLATGARVKMEGYFQNPTWFRGTWRTVAEALHARAPSGFAELSRLPRIGLHVRRADYVDLGWDLSPDFYLAALRAVGAEQSAIVGISDEPSFLPWLAEVVRPLGCKVVAPEPLTGRPAEDDFWNFAACSVLLPANSTFSWWAAAVASARDSRVRVAYPRPWLPDLWAPDPVPDFGLPGWEAIPSRLSARE
jgi:hypothetical protein